ncbi:MAG: thioredoxin family protein [Ignavibacteriae bacterium]|nr:thioredoxin family protein [Ignavibacteriota bacterium]
MASTLSTMLPLGTPLPEFTLPDVVSGKLITPETFKDSTALVVMFICRHCPYVKHVEDELPRLAKDYAAQRVGFVAITSNDAENYPEDSPESSAEMAKELGFTFPFCYDEDQLVAQAFQAACTPEFYLFDSARRLAYRGQLDDSRRSNSIPVTGKDLRAAIDAVLAGAPVSQNQIPSIGCNIKWKPGNEPAYLNLTT